MSLQKYFFFAIISSTCCIQSSSSFELFGKIRRYNDNMADTHCEGIKVTSKSGCLDLQHCLEYRNDRTKQLHYLGCEFLINCIWSTDDEVTIFREDCVECEPPEKCSRPKLIITSAGNPYNEDGSLNLDDNRYECHNSNDFSDGEHICGTKHLSPSLQSQKSKKRQVN